MYAYNTTDVFNDLPENTANTYGGFYFKKINGQWQMQSQRYHYDLRPLNSLENLGRNLLTILGSPSPPINGMISTPMGLMPTYQSFIPY